MGRILRDNDNMIAFPGFEGAPYRGSAIPMLKNTDPERTQPQVNLYARVKILDLSKPEQLAEYQRIYDCIAKGYYVFSYEDIQFVKSSNSWTVLIRYGERYAEQPGVLEQRIKLKQGEIVANET